MENCRGIIGGLWGIPSKDFVLIVRAAFEFRKPSLVLTPRLLDPRHYSLIIRQLNVSMTPKMHLMLYIDVR